jgi:hypothetical protein
VASSTNGSFSDSNSITFTVGAGDDFFVQAFLIAGSLFTDAGSVAGAADASHTMTASFTAGDVSLLTPIPEPGMFSMLLAGVVLLGFAARRC